MKLSISETAKLMGISVRTLHYYDEIGLLKPSEVTDSGYRYYDEDELSILQQIIFYRELEFSLKEIKRILSQPEYDARQALRNHRELLVLKQKRLADLLCLVDETLGGFMNMDKTKLTLTDVEEAKNKYAAEAKERWGNTSAYQESMEKEKNRSDNEKIAMMNEVGDIFNAFAKSMDKDPSDPSVQALVERWQNYITTNYYNCTKEILSGLGEMYVNDERFTENLDRYGDGTAKFMSEAIRIYCKN